jgi:hypothetical protein
MIRSVLYQLPIGWAFRLALLRLAWQWRSLLTVVIGVLLTAVIGASVPLYTTAIAQVGMVQRLDEQPPADANIFSRVSLKAQDAGDLGAAWAQLDDNYAAAASTLAGDVSGWVSRISPAGETTPVQIAGREDARARVAYYDNWQDVVQVVEGRLPSAGAAGDPIEAAVGLRAAIALNLAVGDEITLDQGGWESSVPFQVRITATVREADPDDAYWMTPAPLRLSTSSQGQQETNLLATREDFLRAAGYIPETRSTFGWRLIFDHSRLPYGSLDGALERLAAFKVALPNALLNGTSFEDAQVVYNTKLDEVLEDYQAEVGRLNAPFGLVLLQIGALALFFLVVTAALVRRSERREVAMLQSRGALDRQILALRGAEALVICALATLAAPLVARQFLVWLTPLLAGVERLPLPLAPNVFLYAGTVALVALVALVMTLRPVLRLPLILAGGGSTRAEKHAWWQRYYLDVALLVLGGAALLRLLNTGSALTTTQAGAQKADPLLLLAPALLFVALGSLMLRLFPPVMAMAARLLAARPGLTGALATWQVSREPAHYSRITFLLALSIGIGWFATSFQATMSLSQRDQARYAVGADVRLEMRSRAEGVDRAGPVADYLAMPGVEAATATQRFFFSNVSSDPSTPSRGELLTVDPDTFDGVAYWRGDLGDIQYPRAPGEPSPVPTPGLELPGVPARVGVWMHFVDPSFEERQSYFGPEPQDWRPDITIRLQDDAGSFFVVPLAEIETGALPSPLDAHPLAGADRWLYYEGALDAAPQGALRLISIDWVHRLQSFWRAGDGLTLSLYGLTLTGGDGAVTELDWLTGRDDWEAVGDPLLALEVQHAGTVEAPGAPALQCMQTVWSQDEQAGILGLFPNYPEAGPVPAVASEALVEANDLLTGALFQMGAINGIAPWYEITGTTRYFPTLYQDERLFLVADQTVLLYTLNRRPGATVYPTELWLKLAPDAESEAFAAQLETQDPTRIVLEAHTLGGTLDDLSTDTLSVGLMGLLYLAFFIALALSVVSLLTYVALTVQARRGELGVLRALGISSTWLVMSMALEQVLVMVTGGALGAVLGAVLSYQVLPVLATNTGGTAITPPFLVQVELATLLQYALVLLVVLVFALMTSLVLIRRQSLAQTLRLGEE